MPSTTAPAEIPAVTIPLPVVVRLPVNPPMPIIEAVELPVKALLSQTEVLVENDISSMICDDECIAAIFDAANLDSGTLTINGVEVSSGSKGIEVPFSGKQGKITAVVTSADGASVLELSSDFDRVFVDHPAASSSMDSADGSTTATESTSGSSKSIYIYVLIALVILVAIGYMRRKKATPAN